MLDRTRDIPVLVKHLVSAHSRRMGKAIETIPEETMTALTRLPWPRSMRELENFLERGVNLTRGSVLYVPLAELETETEKEEADLESPTLKAAEREHILRVLRETKGQSDGHDGAAARLGLKRTTLNSQLKKLGIERSDYIQSRCRDFVIVTPSPAIQSASFRFCPSLTNSFHIRMSRRQIRPWRCLARRLH